jgi:hypothetical protein
MLLTLASARDANGAILRKPKRYLPQRLAQDPVKTAALWDIKTHIADSQPPQKRLAESSSDIDR